MGTHIMKTGITGLWRGHHWHDFGKVFDSKIETTGRRATPVEPRDVTIESRILNFRSGGVFKTRCSTPNLVVQFREFRGEAGP